VIADNSAIVVNKIFAVQGLSFPIVWAGVFAFAVQIYADFSGYTDIARGTARLLGIDLMVNFNHPYLATSPADFWRRWHISLSTWLRDFIYIPLGGSRCSTARASFNLMATFAISGLWHGASWNYVIWGIYWGALILLQRFLGWLGLTQRIPWSVKVIITFGVTCAGWLLFRERNLGQIAHDLAQSPFAASADQWRIGFYFVTLVLIYALPLVIHMLATGLPRWRLDLRLSDRGKFVLETAIAVVLVLGIVTIRSVATSDFIYFQF
jgi:D-alanyl-lipoteichoic acid acyltransferase DltB (MBOAT superfamily)